jgi:hypothetical protein
VTVYRFVVVHFDHLRSVTIPGGANPLFWPGFMMPDSTRPTGTVPIPEIL